MSQKVELRKQESPKALGYGKYYWHAAYEKNFIETEQLADFIQTQASIKKSDIKATLDELGAAMKHFFEMGQKIRLDGIVSSRLASRRKVRRMSLRHRWRTL